MNILQTIAGWMGRGSALPPEPVIPTGAPLIYLEDGSDLRWNTMAAVRMALGGKGTISGNRVDLGGAVLSGKALTHPANRQDENACGLEISVPGLTLSNGYVLDIPGGIKVQSPDCQFSNLIFLQIGEDAISTVRREALRITISRCKFWNAGGDKTIQLNQAGGAYLKDLQINGGTTGIRVQKADWASAGTQMIADSVNFEGVNTAWNVDGGARVQCNGGEYKNVRKKTVYGTKGGGGKVVFA